MRRSRPSRCRRPSPLLALALALLALLALPAALLPAAEGAKQRTHYDVLELQKDASLKDIKKAYRKLAVQHHPDRNPGKEEEATVKFREISEAYEVLSDEGTRRDYDAALKGGFGGGAGGGPGNFKWSFGGPGGGAHPRGRQHRDPFAQFNDVFKNDPFFADAFKGMDDLFKMHFSGGGRGSAGGGGGGGGGGGRRANTRFEMKMPSGFGGGGSSTFSSSSFSFGSGGGGGTYTSRSTRTVIQDGKRVTIQSLEKDGNKIEEKYVGEELIERSINGVREDVGRISGGGNKGREF